METIQQLPKFKSAGAKQLFYVIARNGLEKRGKDSAQRVISSYGTDDLIEILHWLNEETQFTYSICKKIVRETLVLRFNKMKSQIEVLDSLLFEISL